MMATVFYVDLQPPEGLGELVHCPYCVNSATCYCLGVASDEVSTATKEVPFGIITFKFYNDGLINQR